jgi:hypothetical protein
VVEGPIGAALSCGTADGYQQIGQALDHGGSMLWVDALEDLAGKGLFLVLEPVGLLATGLRQCDDCGPAVGPVGVSAQIAFVEQPLQVARERAGSDAEPSPERSHPERALQPESFERRGLRDRHSAAEDVGPLGYGEAPDECAHVMQQATSSRFHNLNLVVEYNEVKGQGFSGCWRF